MALLIAGPSMVFPSPVAPNDFTSRSPAAGGAAPSSPSAFDPAWTTVRSAPTAKAAPQMAAPASCKKSLRGLVSLDMGLLLKDNESSVSHFNDNYVEKGEDSLMRHRVYHEVRSQAQTESGELFRITRIVGVLPGIAEVGVKAERRHQPAVLVVDAFELLFAAATFRGGPTAYPSGLRRHLLLVGQIEQDVKNWIVLGNIHDRAVGKHLAHASYEDRPFQVAPKIVAHEKSA